MFFIAPQDAYSHNKRLAKEVGKRGSAVRSKAGLPFNKLSVDAFYLHEIQNSSSWDVQLDRMSEWMWWKAGRPYYNLWPAAIEALMGFAAERIPIGFISDAPEKSIAVQFPEGGVNGVRCVTLSAVSNDGLERRRGPLA